MTVATNCPFYAVFKASRVKRANLREVFPDDFSTVVGWSSGPIEGCSYNMPGPDTKPGWCYPGSPGWIIKHGDGYLTSAGTAHVLLTDAEHVLFTYLADR